MSRFDLFFVLIDVCDAGPVDYEIAQRILKTHRQLVEGVSSGPDDAPPPYTVDDIQKYIMFARCFKPTISDEAADALVDQYKRLRLRDSTGGSGGSWRITVRQLESLIRLSEALARMHCDEKVTVEHVREASKLLNKSIVRVEQPDIAFDGDEEHEVMDGMDEQNAEVAGAKENQTPPEEEGQETDKAMPRVDPAKLKMTYEKYKEISDLIVLHIRGEEDKHTGEEEPGVRRSAVINWYLD